MKNSDSLKTPRRYGKVQIKKDIINQGGFATDLQKTMLALNELKSAYINLQGKGTSDYYRCSSKISVSDGKNIRSAISEFLKQVEHILHPKNPNNFQSININK